MPVMLAIHIFHYLHLPEEYYSLINVVTVCAAFHFCNCRDVRSSDVQPGYDDAQVLLDSVFDCDI